MKISSPAFGQNGQIPEKHTCLGENVNPPLFFAGIPSNAKSLVLTFQDTSADPVWEHWLLFNIDPNTKEIEEGKIPDGAVEGLANNNTFGYEGPCPKYFTGQHLYKWTLYALDKVLDISKESDTEAVIENMAGSVIRSASLEVEMEGLKDN